ncbi:DUF1129 domain-containing protein [Streptococcus ovis]|uniref:DUF1129 domain-containing protein n=1 Tax=Streptococcus ovis TaxID=82806 RepID=UPI00036C7F65|nr:DUF1129 family protein [Streptococcus ovis]
MDLQQLTKKNQEFIHIATNQLIKDGKSDEEIKALLEEILPSILENQKRGITARTLFGAPSDWARSQSEVASEIDAVPENDNPWLMWLDSSLLIIAILGVVNGVMNMLRQGTQYGLLTFLIIGFGVGAGIYMMYHYVYRHMADGKNRPKLGKAILLLFVATIAWSAIFFLASLIPTSINPVLPPLATIVIGALAFGLRYLLKKKYNIRNAMQPVR